MGACVRACVHVGVGVGGWVGGWVGVRVRMCVRVCDTYAGVCVWGDGRKSRQGHGPVGKRARTLWTTKGGAVGGGGGGDGSIKYPPTAGLTRH